MIRFNVNDKGVSLSKDGYAEFQKYVMTTSDIVNRFIKALPQFKKLGECEFNERKGMLIDFFNNPARTTIKMSVDVFTDFNYGYGMVNGKPEMIVMWYDDNNLLNFGTWVCNELFNGMFMKISVTDGDVFIKSYDELCQYNKNMETLSNVNVDEDKSDNDFEDIPFDDPETASINNKPQAAPKNTTSLFNSGIYTSFVEDTKNKIKDQMKKKAVNVIKDFLDKQIDGSKVTKQKELDLALLNEEIENIDKELTDLTEQKNTYFNKYKDIMAKIAKLKIDKMKLKYEIYNLKKEIKK